MISHPDLDHYYGFKSIFESRKLKVEKIFHNGIVERSGKAKPGEKWFADLGRKITDDESGDVFLWDTVLTNKEMHALLDEQKKSRKYYMKTLLAARANNKKVDFQFLDSSKKHLDKFTDKKTLSIEVLAPIAEEVTLKNKTRPCLIKLGNEGQTKNGHSIVLKLVHGKLRMILGGDLNVKSQNYLARRLSGIDASLEDLEKKIKGLREKLAYDKSLSTKKRKDLEQDLEEKKDLLNLIVTKTKKYFSCDIAKACHHGASDILDSFLFAYNPIATIISSGDEESHSHPRPDALGAFGRSSRGNRPLIFSTELARSSKEFSYPIKFYNVLKRIEETMNAETNPKRKENLRKRMESLRESNVAKYGMITVRSDGERVIIAQMLEKARSSGQRWDIYDLNWNPKLEEYEYKA